MEIKLSYTPLRLVSGNISENDFDLYINQPKWGSVAKKITIEPFEESMKKEDREEFKLGDLTIRQKRQKKDTTSWQGVYDSLQEFLSVRALDSRAFEMEGLQFFDGLGYCILTKDLKDFVNGNIKENTTHSEFFQLYWPRMKKNENFPNEITLPDVDYNKITPLNASTVLKAKRFCKGLENEVTNAFKSANQEWFENQTGYNKEKLPVKDDSPIRKTRMIAGNKPVFIQLVREEVPQYREIVDMLITELTDLESGVALEGYKVRRESGKTYINIKTLQDRFLTNRLEKDNLINVKGRYEIVP